MTLYEIDHVPGNLGSKHTEVVGKNRKENADTETKPVFVEIFTEMFKVLQLSTLGKFSKQDAVLGFEFGAHHSAVANPAFDPRLYRVGINRAPSGVIHRSNRLATGRSRQGLAHRRCLSQLPHS